MNNSSLVSTLRAGASALALIALVGISPVSAQTAQSDETAAETQATVSSGLVEAWGLEPTDVQPDPAIRYGRLENGMRYAIRPNNTPEGAVSIRLHIDFGSVNEAENERGLAHFIEHMAFNGSTNVPEGEMIPMLERLGFAFGPDTNALTDFNQTNYRLDISTVNEERLDKALFLMRETASELLFTPEAVNRERGVIISERRTRDSVGLRNAVDQIDFMLPDSLYSERLPIGTEEVLLNAPAARLKALYRRFYRPENATLIVVGDIDPADIEARITARFADWEAVGPAGIKAPVGKADLERTLSFDSFVDPAAPSQVQIIINQAYEDPMDTVALRFKTQLERLGRAMMNARIQRIAQQPESLIVGGGAVSSEFRDSSKYSVIVLSTRDGEWPTGLTIAEQELRRALDHGFTEAELGRTLANVEQTYRQNAEQGATRTTRSLANGILSNAASNNLNTDPAWRYAMFQAFKPQLTVENVNAAFRALYSGSDPLVHVATKELAGGEETIAEVFKASAATPVAAPVDAAVGEFGYDNFGDAPGKIVSDTMIEDLGIRTITFANNVRLNLKQTDYEDGKIRFNIAMDGGTFALPDNDVGNGLFFLLTGATMGTVKHSAQEFGDILAGKAALLGMSASEDSFDASGTTTPEFLALQMKVSAAYFTDNGYRPEAQAQWNGLLDVIYNQLLASPQTVFQIKAGGLITQDDPRFDLPSKETLAAVSQENFREALTERAANGAIEIALVGDIDQDAAIAAVAATFGALPVREADFRPYSNNREVELRQTFEPVTLIHTGQADQAIAASLWRTADDSDYRTEVGMDLLKEVVALRALEVLRETLGATYTPDVGSDMSDTYKDYGLFSISAVVAPADVKRSLTAIPQIIADLRENGIDEDLLARARAPMVEKLEAAKRGNGYWIGVASRAQSKSERLDRARAKANILAELTAEDLRALLGKYLTDTRRIDLQIVSDKVEMPTESE